MRPTLLLLAPFLFLFACNAPSKEPSTKSNPTPTQSQMEEPQKLLRHVVLFQFTDSATEEIVTQIEQAFAALPEKIPAIHSFEWGVNNSPEGLDKGLTHCFLVTFLSEQDRETYLPHPDHQAFVKLVGPYVKDVTVVDYWAQ